MKNTLKAKKIKAEIKKLNPETHPNTIIRAQYIYKLLSSEMNSAEIGRELKISPKSANRWKEKFLQEGIDGLKGMEKNPIIKSKNKKGATLSEGDIANLEQDLLNLDKVNHPRTNLRGQVILSVLKKENTRKKAAQKLGVSVPTIAYWISLFEKKGLNGLKSIEKYSLLTHRDTSKDKALLVELKEALKNIDKKKNPLGKKQLELIIKIVEKKKTSKEISIDFNYNIATIRNWFSKIHKKGLAKFLSGSENSTLNKRLVLDNITASNQKPADTAYKKLTKNGTSDSDYDSDYSPENSEENRNEKDLNSFKKPQLSKNMEDGAKRKNKKQTQGNKKRRKTSRNIR